MENNIFEQNAILKSFMKLSLPLVFSMMITIIYNVVDTYFIARTGNLNLVAGVSLCAPVFTILMAFGNILAQGGSSLCARLLGEQKIDHVKHVSSFCWYTAILLGAAAAVILLVGRNFFLHVLGASPATFEYASSYYTVMAIGAPFLTLTFVPSNLLRTEGIASHSMIATVAGSILNIILDPILIFNLNLGAVGAAAATILGYVLSDLMFIGIMLRESRILSFNPRYFRIPLDDIRQIFGIGIPAALTNWMSSLCVIMTNNSLLSYGDDKIAAMGVAMKIIMIGTLCLTGFSFGGAPMIGYFYGSRNKAKMKELFRFCYSFILIVGLVLGAVLFLGAPMLISAFLDDHTLLAETVTIFRLQAVCLPFASIVMMSTIYCQSFGKMVGSFILSLSRQGFVFILVLLVLSHLFGYTGIIASQLGSDLVSGAIAFAVITRILLPSINQLD